MMTVGEATGVLLGAVGVKTKGAVPAIASRVRAISVFRTTAVEVPAHDAGRGEVNWQAIPVPRKRITPQIRNTFVCLL
ncbi:protein of unknown function [Brevefilum fermentans]|uniref:Uncharacterized protein n=1 Tax=Candidatus Brevifilum fermentans TaxID=1986204 RepID=A0A1Y6K1E0_9CHLR|nr:protein of unknown function [Brevefilum fermentans]